MCFDVETWLRLGQIQNVNSLAEETKGGGLSERGLQHHIEMMGMGTCSAMPRVGAKTTGASENGRAPGHSIIL